MSNSKITIAVVVVIVLAAVAYFAFANKATAPVPTDTATTTDTTTASSSATGAGATAGVAAQAAIITYTDSGFSPKATSVKVGDTVRFVNNSSRGMWVASDVHPTHTKYDGTSLQQHCSAGTDTNGGFDECSAVNAGAVYSFTFTKAGTFSFHNHVSASDTGTVTVTQ